MLEKNAVVKAKGESWIVIQLEASGKYIVKAVKGGRLTKIEEKDVEVGEKPRYKVPHGFNPLNDAKHFEKGDVVNFTSGDNERATDAVVLWTHYGKVVVRVTATEVTMRLDPSEVTIRMGKAPVEFHGFAKAKGGGLSAALREMPASPWTSK